MLRLRSIFHALLLFAVWQGSHGEESCLELGFTTETPCSDCNRLADYVRDEGLVKECQACCVEDSGNTDERTFQHATLEICKHRLREFPTVEEFVAKKADGFPNLVITQKFGTWPRLILQDGRDREAVRIESWKTEQIEEYLRHRLAPVTSADA